MKLAVVIFILSFIFIWDTSLYGQPNKVNLSNLKITEINYETLLKQKNKVLLSQIASDVKYIPLETNKECMISASARYHFTEDFIFVQEMDHVLKFSLNGKFLKKIGNPGRGPGEIIRITSMSVLPEKRLIALYELGRRKMSYYSFDGMLIKTINVPWSYRDIRVMNDGNFFVHDQGLDKSEKYTFLLTKESGDTLSVVKNYKTWTKTSGPYRITDFLFEPFYSYQKKGFFKTLYNDTIYTIENDKIVPSFFINLGKYKLPEEKILERIPESFASVRKTYSTFCYASVFEANNKLFLTVENYGKKEIRNFIINNKDYGSFYQNVLCGSIINDWDCGLPFWPTGAMNSIKVFMPIEIITIKKYFQFVKTQQAICKFPEKQNELKNLIIKSDLSDNPILMILTLNPDK
jgi:hypothetical protein